MINLFPGLLKHLTSDEERKNLPIPPPPPPPQPRKRRKRTKTCNNPSALIKNAPSSQHQPSVSQ